MILPHPLLLYIKHVPQELWRTRAADGQSLLHGLHLCAPIFGHARMNHKFMLHQVSRSCCASCRPANFTVSSGSGPAANIIVADMEASRVSPCLSP